MISVIIPVYNGGSLLRPCLESVLSQSYADLEILLIDDGSTDGSWETALEFAAGDSRVQPLRQENAGVSAARNRGIAMARGEFLTFVDSDDLLPPDALRHLLKHTADADLVIGSYEEFRGSRNRRVLWHPGVYDRREILADIARFDPAIRSPWGKLYRSEALKAGHIRFDETLPYGEDHVFNLCFCRYAQRIVLLDTVVYRYRLGGIASSVKYYPDKYRLSLAMLDAYGALFGGVADIPSAFWKQELRGHLLGTVSHYRIHCGFSEALSKTEAALEAFGPYLNSDTVDASVYPPEMVRCILARDARELLWQVSRQRFFPILRKKCKGVYYRIFQKRL